MAHRARRHRPMAQINVVPYIDVMLVLLVIFMVTAPMLQQGVEIQLPQAPSRPLQETKRVEPIVVQVGADGRFYLKPVRVPIPETALAAAVRRERAADPRRPVYVEGDRTVAYARVVQALVLLKEAGVGDVGLITEPPSPPEE